MTQQIDPDQLALDASVDHVRGTTGALILEYGDYECPYSRMAYQSIQRLEQQLNGRVRFAFRHFPLTDIHPRALAAAAAAEAAANQGLFWAMHDSLFHHQEALQTEHLQTYAAELGLDMDAFERDVRGDAVAARISRDVESGIASGDVLGTPTLFIDGRVYRGPYDAATLLRLLSD